MLNRLRWLLGLPVPVKVHPIFCASLPQYHHDGDSGLDVTVDSLHDLTIFPGQIMAVPTGLKVEIPRGFELQIRPRSSLAQEGITVANAPGTIDSTYRGEIQVLLHNHSIDSYSIAPGHRIAQLVLAPVAQCRWVESGGLDWSNTSRGAGGFGSTGK